MYYLTINEAGVQELRNSPIDELPAGAVPLSHDEYECLMRGTHVWAGGAIVPAPAPMSLPPQPDWAGFQSFCFTDIFAGDSVAVSQLIDRYPSFLLGIQTKNLGIVQAAVDRALADHTLNPMTGIPQLTADAIHAAITTYHLEGA